MPCLILSYLGLLCDMIMILAKNKNDGNDDEHSNCVHGDNSDEDGYPHTSESVSSFAKRSLLLPATYLAGHPRKRNWTPLGLKPVCSWVKG